MSNQSPPGFPWRSRPDVLSRSTCLRLLPTVPIGRLIFVHAGTPRAYPMNFTAEGPIVWLRSDTVGAAASISPDQTVAFEADTYDAWLCTGWSVLITGSLRWLDDEACRHPGPARPWAPGPRTRIGRLEGRHVSGRRISHPAG